MNPSADILDLQSAIVVSVAQSINDNWKQIVLNYEIDYPKGELVENYIGFYIKVGENNQLSMIQIYFSDEMLGLLQKLRAKGLELNNEPWCTCDIVIESNGEYQFDFSFEPPKRINGILDEESYGRFNKYLDNYVIPSDA